MALVTRADRARSHPRSSRRRAAVAIGVAALLATAVAACGGGGGGSSSGQGSGGGVKDGFTQAPQSSGALTVWVDGHGEPGEPRSVPSE
jgi:hypothetical protein